MRGILGWLLRFGWKNPWLTLLSIGATQWVAARRRARIRAGVARLPGPVGNLLMAALGGAAWLAGGAAGTRFMTFFLRDGVKALAAITPSPGPPAAAAATALKPILRFLLDIVSLRYLGPIYGL